MTSTTSFADSTGAVPLFAEARSNPAIPAITRAMPPPIGTAPPTTVASVTPSAMAPTLITPTKTRDIPTAAAECSEVVFMLSNDLVERPTELRFRTGEHAIHCEHGAATLRHGPAPTCC